MHCAKKCGLFIVLTLLGIGIVSAIATGFAAEWLSVSDKPQKSDAIIVLGGDFSRPFQAADLYKQEFAAKVYVSSPVREHSLRLLDEAGIAFPRQEEVYRQILLKKGVPADAIEFFGKELISTAAEAKTVQALFAGKAHKLIVVTSPFHLRRTRMIFTDALPDTDIRFVATAYEPLPKQWWTSQDAARNVLLEIPKIVFYRIGGRF
jgi:uncharacterized SAM-binding protein YcdF (DUF218 family)